MVTAGAVDVLGATEFFLTVTFTVPSLRVFLPFFSLTVMFVFPAFFAVTTPFLLTLAIEAFLLLNVYFAFFALFLILMVFFLPTVIVSFLVDNLAFLAAWASAPGTLATVRAKAITTAMRLPHLVFKLLIIPSLSICF